MNVYLCQMEKACVILGTIKKPPGSYFFQKQRKLFHTESVTVKHRLTQKIELLLQKFILKIKSDIVPFVLLRRKGIISD